MGAGLLALCLGDVQLRLRDLDLWVMALGAVVFLVGVALWDGTVMAVGFGLLVFPAILQG